MINRANQSWPKETTINLVQHAGELKPFGRVLAMRMLLDKAETPQPAMADDPILNPYCHELNNRGTSCADDCQACRWAEEKNKKGN